MEGLNAGEASASGGGENFMAFMEKELIPYIDSHYQTAGYRIFSGHSFGGLAVINAFFNHAKLFNAYIALDPSLWWEKQQWIKKQEAEMSKHDFSNRSLFVGIANNIPPGWIRYQYLKIPAFFSAGYPGRIALCAFSKRHQVRKDCTGPPNFIPPSVMVRLN